MSFRIYADLGNTTLHWAIYRLDAEAGWAAAGRVRTGHDFAARCARAIDDLLEQAGAQASDCLGGLALSSRPSDSAGFSLVAGDCLGIEIPLLTHETAASVRTEYTDRTQIGLDRLANVAGLDGLAQPPAVIADVGSCITVDYVDAGGVLIGGAIAPGLPVMKAGLLARTPHLQEALDALEPPEDASSPGRSTQECIALGLFAALAATPVLLAEDFCREELRVVRVLTGGDATWVQTRTGWADHVDQLLTLKGLHRLDPEAHN